MQRFTHAALVGAIASGVTVGLWAPAGQAQSPAGVRRAHHRPRPSNDASTARTAAV